MEVEHKHKTLSVPDAGEEFFGLSRNASYKAAQRGEIPTVRIGRLLRVPLVALERKLAEAGTLTSTSATTPPTERPIA
jgi:hypothetical protein